MKDYTVSFKQYNMLCDKCLMKVIKCLSTLHGLDSFNVSLESKKIKVKYKDKSISKEMIQAMINETIITGKIQNIYAFN